jgi:hypothetical protein
VCEDLTRHAAAQLKRSQLRGRALVAAVLFTASAPIVVVVVVVVVVFASATADSHHCHEGQQLRP